MPPFDVSDIYMVCLLRAEDDTIDIPQEALQNEIKEAKWVEFKEMQHMNFTKMTSAVCKVLELAREEKGELLETLGKA